MQAIHPQHARHADGLAADATALRVQRLDLRIQPHPRHFALDLGEEHLATRALLLQGELGAGKTALVHRHGALLRDPFRHARSVPAWN
jgi:MoxR-like ATPase